MTGMTSAYYKLMKSTYGEAWNPEDDGDWVYNSDDSNHSSLDGRRILMTHEERKALYPEEYGADESNAENELYGYVTDEGEEELEIELPDLSGEVESECTFSRR